MIFKGITFNEVHSFGDLGLKIEKKKIGNPSKVKTKVKPPFSNIEYDMSELYGGQVFSERPLSYTFHVLNEFSQEAEDMNVIKIKALNLFMADGKKHILRDDEIPGYYFIAEVINSPDFEEKNGIGSLTVEFTAYPFKIKELAEFSDVWDDFAFELDVAQETKFNVKGQEEVIIINTGSISVVPEITVNAAMEVAKDGQQYILKNGVNKNDDFRLDVGENYFVVKGTGMFEIKFHKEVL